MIWQELNQQAITTPLTIDELIKQAQDEEEQQEYTPQLLIALNIPIECHYTNIHHQLILIRHALAWHNYYKRTVKQINNDYHYFLLDPPLHKIGKLQCENMKKIIHQQRFSIVFVSPLMRAIQTAQLLFYDHPYKQEIRFILNPICSEKLSSQHSIYKWGNLSQLRTQIQNDQGIDFDFSLFDYDIEFWQVKLTSQQNIPIQLQPTRQNQENSLNQIKFENSQQVYERACQFKLIIKQLLKEHPNKIGIVSHSQFLKSFLSDKPKIDGKYSNDIHLQNGSIIGMEL